MHRSRSRPGNVGPVFPASVKLIASDLDGTLLGPDARVSDRTAAAVRAVAAAGMDVVIATGRSHWSALPLVEHLGCIRWLLCSNGATVFDLEAGDAVHRRFLSGGLVADLMARILDAFPTAGFAWESAMGIAQTERWVTNRLATNPTYRPSTAEPVHDLAPGDGPMVKLLVAHDELITYDWLAALEPLLPSGVCASTSGASFAEITVAEANKADALAHLCLQLGVDRSATIAFGDHANDVGMLEWAATGFAMANAHPLVAARADHVAPHHGDDGVAQVLERLLASGPASGF